MALSDAVIKKIAQLSQEQKQNEIFEYLKPKLKDGEISAQDVYDYAKKRRWSKTQGKPYVIHAGTINKLGVVVSALPDKHQKLLAIEFYLLAAERDFAFGCKNYAQHLLNNEGDYEKALEYAQKAVELSKDTKAPHQHKYILAKALKANSFYKKALTAIQDYLVYAISIKKDDDILKAWNFATEMLSELLEDIEEDCEYSLEAAQLVTSRWNLNPNPKVLLLKQHAFFVEGKCYQHLNNPSKAWVAYCQVEDKDSIFYTQAVTIRKELLKKNIAEQFEKLIGNIARIPSLSSTKEKSNTDENSSIIFKPSPKKQVDTHLLPNGTPFILGFAGLWNNDSPFFHSANDDALTKRYSKRLHSIETMIKGKKEEVTLVKKAIQKGIGKLDELEAKKTSFEEELNQLQETKEKIEQSYQQHTAINRQTLRRHSTETRFFDYQQIKNPEILKEIRGLTFELIDQRFSVDNSGAPKINLNGKSSFMLIAAERVFQEAVITLSSESKEVVLGIPRVRANNWDYGYVSGTNWFGPIEHYHIGDTNIETEHRTNPKRQRLGDSYMRQHGKYTGDIYNFLKRISNETSENEKEIARYVIRYGKCYEEITVEELRTFYPDADERDVNHFNQIAFLIMGKEQAQWHSATDNRYQLGMSVAQARALIMLEAGFLRLEELFKNDVMFGVYSQTNINNSPQKVAEACNFIDELYTHFILNRHQNDSMRFFKAQMQSKEKRTAVLTRTQARDDLKYVYGEYADLSEEGYDTDLDFNEPETGKF